MTIHWPTLPSVRGEMTGKKKWMSHSSFYQWGSDCSNEAPSLARRRQNEAVFGLHWSWGVSHLRELLLQPQKKKHPERVVFTSSQQRISAPPPLPSVGILDAPGRALAPGLNAARSWQLDAWWPRMLPLGSPGANESLQRRDRADGLRKCGQPAWPPVH